MTPLRLETPRLILELPREDMAEEAFAFHQRNRQHLARWFPPTPPGFDTLPFWIDYVQKTQEAFAAGSMVRFWAWRRAAPHDIVATLGFSQIFRGPFCNCVLGYQVDGASEGQGLMSEALREAIRYMFEVQRLHRINANYRPENARSGRLLARLGFRIDGLARDYLFIDGAWRDHVQTSLINEAFRTEWLQPA